MAEPCPQPGYDLSRAPPWLTCRAGCCPPARGFPRARPRPPSPVFALDQACEGQDAVGVGEGLRTPSILTLPERLTFSQELCGAPVVLGGFCTMSSLGGSGGGIGACILQGGRSGSRNLPPALTPAPGFAGGLGPLLPEALEARTPSCEEASLFPPARRCPPVSRTAG